MKKVGTTYLVSVFVMLMLTPNFKAQASIGDAGNERCGMGTNIFGRGQSICSQSSEESTNGMSSGTFSVTTGTSGCKNSGIVKATQEEIHYANINFEELQFESSLGKGEVLAGFAETVGCSKSSESRFSELMQKNHSYLFSAPTTSPEVMLMGVKSIVENDVVLSQACARRAG